MLATIAKWGNSLALRLPRHVTDAANIVEGTTVEIVVDDGVLKIIPARRKLRLADLLEGEPKRPGHDAFEVDWGQPKGNETW